MFTKLSQRSTSWWLCVMISSAFAACLLTVLIHPAYAALCVGVCAENNCGPFVPAIHCGKCDLQFDDWEFRAEVLNGDRWNVGNTCFGRINSYHKARAHNGAGTEKWVEFFYSGFINRIVGAEDNCPNILDPPPNLPVEGRLNVPAGEWRTNTFTLSVTYALAAVGENCEYARQAVTEWTFESGQGGDTQVECDAFDNCP